MKRALAERAKQSGIPNVDSPPEVSAVPENTISLNAHDHAAPPALLYPPSNNDDPCFDSAPFQVPPKHEPPLAPFLFQQQNLSKVVIPKQEENTNDPSSTSVTPSTSKTVGSPRPTPSPRPKKRLREGTTDKFKLLQEEDEDDSSSSAFYLKHQNRALSSELRSVKYQLSRLERERDFRRRQSLQALQSINTLESIWRQLESSFRRNDSFVSGNKVSTGSSAKLLSLNKDPLSTGSGASVETIGAFLKSLAQLGASTKSSTLEETSKNTSGVEKCETKDDCRLDVNEELDSASGEAEDSSIERKFLSDLTQITENITERAALLQTWIWNCLHNDEKSHLLNGKVMSPSPAMELQTKISHLESENMSLHQQIEELGRSRDEILESDRRVRRGLYRLAAGRVQLKEVLKAVAIADEDKEAAEAWMDAGPAPVAGSPLTFSATSNTNISVEKIKSEDDNPAEVSSEELVQLKKQMADLHEVTAAKEEQIKHLLSEREEHMKRISTLVLQEKASLSDAPTNQELQQSDLYLELSTKLVEKERMVQVLEEKSDRIKEEWSTALANAELSRQAMDEMHSKHLKRWAELVEENPDIRGDDDSGDTNARTSAEEIATLQHKLTQALEIVRQAKSTTKTLDEAMAMNDSLQAKVDEYKSKYNALQAEKAARGGTSGSSVSSNQVSSVNSGNGASAGIAAQKEKIGVSFVNSSDKGDRSVDKLHRDYKRARKELAAATASKEAAKAKLERIEKEKDFLNQMNSRLIKQAAEKDEINAKSLSTILHLKQLTEQISKEKDNLEQQVKSAEQLALAARLASNARDRVAEEFDKEKRRLEGQVAKWEKKCVVLTQEKALVEGKLSQEKARVSMLITDAQKAKERCEELASESTKLQEEKHKMMESLVVAQREAAEATNMSQQLSESQGGGMAAGFTVEQLSTQVTVLKNRLACPVCNVHDKKCILLRCRHMFCKQCIDENVKNRSRKCPACGGRFDTKDVADVWL